jgi:hypothetical protein
MMSKTWSAGLAKTENSVKARAMLDLMCQDIIASVSRPDLPAFRDASGSSAPVFYTRRPGVAEGADPKTIRPFSLVSYEYDSSGDPNDSNSPKLIRRDVPVLWTTTATPFRQDGQIADAATLGSQPPREIAPGIIAYSLKFLSTDQTLSDTYYPSDPTDPFYVVNGNTYDATKASRAVVVSVAVIDAKTLNLLKKTGTLSALQGALSSVVGNGNVLSKWQQDIAGGKLAGSGIPRAAAANLLVLERFIPLPSQL